jgi:hypothetical protein
MYNTIKEIEQKILIEELEARIKSYQADIETIKQGILQLKSNFGFKEGQPLELIQVVKAITPLLPAIMIGNYKSIESKFTGLAETFEILKKYE